MSLSVLKTFTYRFKTTRSRYEKIATPSSSSSSSSSHTRICLYLSVTEGTATIKTDSSAMAMENAMMNAMKENAMEMHGADRIVLKRYVNVFKTDKLTGCYGQWTSSFWLVQSHSFTQDIIIKRSVLVAMVTLLNESYYHVTSLAQSRSKSKIAS